MGATDEINCFLKNKVLMLLWEFFYLLIFCPNKAVVLKVIWTPFYLEVYTLHSKS